MISYWKFDEGEGTMAYDSVGDNHGTIYGASWTTGIVDGALTFDGMDNYVSLPDSASLSPTAGVTLEAWIKPADLITDQHIISTAGPGPSPFGHDYYIRLVYKGLEFRINDVPFFVGNSVTVANEWYHVIGTYDQSQGLRKIYVNDNLPGASSYSLPINTGHDYVTIGLNARKLAFGDTIFKAFNGIIDEVAIYDRALTEKEIHVHYEYALRGHGYLDPEVRIEVSIAKKLQVLERIDAALEEEWAAYGALEELLASGDYSDLKRGDIVAAKQKIHSAIQHQKQARNALVQSLQKLEDSLWLLGYEVQP